MKFKLHIVIFILIFLQNNATAFDDVKTHPDITEKAVRNPEFINYLGNNLGFKDGLQTKMPYNSQNSILILLKQGSTDEDTPNCRASNHFHNPLLPWSESYMSDDTTSLGLAIRLYCGSTGWPYADRKSAVIWAKGNGMGWSDARTYFYNALTSESNTDRETNFAKTFQALEQKTIFQLGGINI